MGGPDMKKQKKDKRRQSTQQLMGIQKITDYCISTDTGDLVFYIVRPSNLGVLPANAIYARIEGKAVRKGRRQIKTEDAVVHLPFGGIVRI